MATENSPHLAEKPSSASEDLLNVKDFFSETAATDSRQNTYLVSSLSEQIDRKMSIPTGGRAENTVKDASSSGQQHASAAPNALDSERVTSNALVADDAKNKQSPKNSPSADAGSNHRRATTSTMGGDGRKKLQSDGVSNGGGERNPSTGAAHSSAAVLSGGSGTGSGSGGRNVEASVFAGLDPFGIDGTADVQAGDTAASYDGMDDVFLQLTRDETQFPSNPENDWQFDNIGVPDLYTNVNSYSQLPLNFMEGAAICNSRSLSQPDVQVNLQGRATSTRAPASVKHPSASVRVSSPENSEPSLNTSHSCSASKAELEQTEVKAPKAESCLTPAEASAPAWRMERRASEPVLETNRSTSMEDAPSTPVIAAAQVRTPTISAARIRSPGSSTSSAPSRSKAPTAICKVCGKSVSTNGANFQRHQRACRRQRAERSSRSKPPTSPALATPPLTGSASCGFATSHNEGQRLRTQESVTADPRRPSSTVYPTPTQAVAATQRRDSDLLQIVHRLEAVVSTLDVGARLCLRDALLSLSSKASNPHVPSTPEQEAMNRAAEYLVLRMLFLSGQQVMHTAPGTAGSYGDDQSGLVGGHMATVPGSAVDDGTTSSIPPHSNASGIGMGSEPSNTRQPGVNDMDDGTIAASTGGASVAVSRSEKMSTDRGSSSIVEPEEKDDAT